MFEKQFLLVYSSCYIIKIIPTIHGVHILITVTEKLNEKLVVFIVFSNYKILSPVGVSLGERPNYSLNKVYIVFESSLVIFIFMMICVPIE